MTETKCNACGHTLSTVNDICPNCEALVFHETDVTPFEKETISIVTYVNQHSEEDDTNANEASDEYEIYSGPASSFEIMMKIFWTLMSIFSIPLAIILWAVWNAET